MADVAELARKAQEAQARSGVIPAQAVVWDDSRNTSQTRQPNPGALKEALRALAKFREEQPRHVAWLAAGAPSINTEEDHVRWFGTTYQGVPWRKQR